MVVDDSVVARAMLSRWIAEEPGLEWVGSAADGAQAVARIGQLEPDVVVLDVEMPVMGGLEALPRLLAAHPRAKVVMASTLTQRGAAAALRALELGATDCVGKPSNEFGGSEPYRAELMRKLRGFGAAAETSARPPWGLRPLPGALPRPEVLVVGASTGGPQALADLITGLGRAWTAPILVVQHMPATFTAALAETLGRVSGRPAREAVDGAPLQPGAVHLAPGDLHMTLVREEEGVRLRLDRGPPVKFCRPAVDPLFASAADVFGAGVLGVVLTGMGVDGRDGAQAVVQAGGLVMAQDRDSSVVWGMPGAVARAGLACAVGPIPDLAVAACKLARGARP